VILLLWCEKEKRVEAMLEGLVRQLLLGYLGRFVKDIPKEQLKIALWNGNPFFFFQISFTTVSIKFIFAFSCRQTNFLLHFLLTFGTSLKK
jgi:hypothetical protein